jgi:hypothetical protein
MNPPEKWIDDHHMTIQYPTLTMAHMQSLCRRLSLWLAAGIAFHAMGGYMKLSGLPLGLGL